MEENTNLRQQLQNLSSIVESMEIKQNDILSGQKENREGLESIEIKQNDILSGQKENREGLGSLLKGWKRKGWKLN